MPTPENFPIWPGWETVRLIGGSGHGRGGFSTVYEIWRDVGGDIETAALKQLSLPFEADFVGENYFEDLPENELASEIKALQRCREEIEKACLLASAANGHPNLLRCEAFRCVPQKNGIGWDIFIRTELLTSLSDRLVKDGMSEAGIVRLGQDLCKALACCEENRIIHGGVKPSNIFIASDGTFKLADLGVSMARDCFWFSSSLSGTPAVGLFTHMAPEFYKGEPISAASDLYSLGLVLYWLLNRRRGPFLPTDSKPPRLEKRGEAFRRRFGGEPIPAPADGCPELQRIVLKACAYAPKDRYQSAKEMLRDLEALPPLPTESLIKATIHYNAS